METISLAFISSAFIAGILTFLAPCTLPLVPAYLGFISGVPHSELANPETKTAAQRKIFLNGLFFVIGFSAVFIVFGTLAGLLGQALVPYRIWLARIGGAFVVLFGLFMLGALNIPFLSSEKRLKLPSFLTLGKPTSSFVIGSTFAFGWTPCVGPILGSILLLASANATAFSGAFMLTVFSAGLAVPFLLVAGGVSRAPTYINKFAKRLKWVSVIGGILLIGLGILLMFDSFNLVIQYGYELFRFIEYDRLLDYL